MLKILAFSLFHHDNYCGSVQLKKKKCCATIIALHHVRATCSGLDCRDLVAP